MVLEQRRVDPYIATGKRSRGRNLSPAPKGRIPTHLTIRQRMERKLLTKAGRADYRLRQQVVEPVFGQIKNKGLIRLLLRGEENCRAEWLLHCTGHNTASCGRSGDDPPDRNRAFESPPGSENPHLINGPMRIHSAGTSASGLQGRRPSIAECYSDGLLGGYARRRVAIPPTREERDTEREEAQAVDRDRQHSHVGEDEPDQGQRPEAAGERSQPPPA
jgi:hypothetical protein